MRFCTLDKARRLARAGGVLGICTYGAGSPAGFPPSIPLAAPRLEGLGEPFCEVWTATEPVSYGTVAGAPAAWTQGLLFGALELGDGPDLPLEHVTYQAYDRLFSALEAGAYGHLLRVWNYFPGITAMEQGLERYRHFSVARHEAFSVHRRSVETAPAASAVGGLGGPLTLLYLAARTPGVPIENPRQVSAYHYPERYGPRSPTFSRALLAGPRNDARLLLSGTASILGHESVHLGDAAAQAVEAMANLQALQHVAETYGFFSTRRLLKTYVRDPATLPAISARLAALLGPSDEIVYLRGELCRPELLVEIEGVCS